RWGVFSRLMTDTEDESWDWGFPFPANALYVYRVFEGEDLLVSEAAYLAQASSNTSRISPTIETEVAGVVCYSTFDRNSSLPTAPEEGNMVTFDMDGETLVLCTSRVDPAPAGSYQRTFTGAASTGLAGTGIYLVSGS